MNLLAIETSTEYCSVAMLVDGVLTEHAEQAGQRHSEILLERIDDLLRKAGCKLRDLDALAFGAGPGSFTGVRIAASVAQGLAFGAGIPVVPVSTLEALAEAEDATKVACALDARLDEVYFAAYEKQEGEKPDGDWQTIISPCLAAIADLPALPGSGWVGAGTGFAVLDGLLVRHLGLADADPSRVPMAREIARLAARKLPEAALEPALGQPVYLRNKVAMTIAERQARGYK